MKAIQFSQNELDLLSSLVSHEVQALEKEVGGLHERRRAFRRIIGQVY